MPVVGRAVVLAARMGRPVWALRYLATVKQVAFGDAAHVLLVDNRQVVPYRASST